MNWILNIIPKYTEYSWFGRQETPNFKDVKRQPKLSC